MPSPHSRKFSPAYGKNIRRNLKIGIAFSEIHDRMVVTVTLGDTKTYGGKYHGIQDY
jgi:hypothetical protein